MEAGDTTESTAPALFENIPVFWQISERRPLYPKFFQQLIALHKAHSALQQRETKWPHKSASDRVLTYIRRGNGEEFLYRRQYVHPPFTGVVDVRNGEYSDVIPGLDARTIALPGISLEAFQFRIYKKRQCETDIFV